MILDDVPGRVEDHCHWLEMARKQLDWTVKLARGYVPEPVATAPIVAPYLGRDEIGTDDECSRTRFDNGFYREYDDVYS